MSLLIKRSFCWLFWMVLTVMCYAQGAVSFSAQADAKQVVIGNYFDLTFTLENAQGANFQPPPLTDFKVLSGPSQAISTTSVNGRWTRSLSYTYTLQPKRVGKFTFNAATIEAEGKKLKTKPVKIEVIKGSANQATTQDDLEKNLSKNIFLRAVPSTSDARTGQQILLDYKIYTTQEVESYNLLNESAYPGFYSQDIRRYNNSPVKEVIDGVQYTTKVLKRVALFPQQAGIMEVDPMQLQIAIIDENQPRRRRSFFFSPALKRFQVASKPIKINVLPLPENAPPSFSGGVGKYNLSTKSKLNKVTTDDAFSVQMTILGTGDAKQVQAPKLSLGDNFEVYDPKVVNESSFTENNGRLVSEKTFDYLILPKQVGNFRMQPAFTYYDTDSLKYITMVDHPIAVNVGQGTGAKAAIDITPEPTQDIYGIKLTTNLKKKSTSFFGGPVFWTLLGLPILFLGGAFWYKQKQDRLNNIDGATLKKQRANKVALERLATAKNYLTDNKSRSFYDEVSRAMLGYVSDKLNIPFSKMSKNNVKEKLESLNVSETPIQKFIHIIQTSEMALFAGKDNSAAMQQVYQEAVDVVSGVEEEMSSL